MGRKHKTPHRSSGGLAVFRGYVPLSLLSIACTMGLVEGERKAMSSAKHVWIAVVLLLVCWSPSAIAMDQSGLQERKANPASRGAVMQEHATTPHESSPLLVAQWWQVPQVNACTCPAIICSELQRSEACHVSCARGRSAYCQCGSCNGIALSSPNYCGCR
jgi:hypothetical protein